MDVPTAAAKNDEHFSKKVFANWIFLAQKYLPYVLRIIKRQFSTAEIEKTKKGSILKVYHKLCRNGF